jgi:hypothetical protein
MTDWAALLEALEDGLESIPPVLIDVASLPATADPVPPALRDDAQRLLRRMAEVEADLERRRVEIGRELAALAAARVAQARVVATGAAKPVPHFLDRRA